MKPRLLRPDPNCQSLSESNRTIWSIFGSVCCIQLLIQLANCAYFIMKLQQGFFYQSKHNLNRVVNFYTHYYTERPALPYVIGSFKKHLLRGALLRGGSDG